MHHLEVFAQEASLLTETKQPSYIIMSPTPIATYLYFYRVHTYILHAVTLHHKTVTVCMPVLYYILTEPTGHWRVVVKGGFETTGETTQ